MRVLTPSERGFAEFPPPSSIANPNAGNSARRESFITTIVTKSKHDVLYAQQYQSLASSEEGQIPLLGIESTSHPQTAASSSQTQRTPFPYSHAPQPAAAGLAVPVWSPSMGTPMPTFWTAPPGHQSAEAGRVSWAEMPWFGKIVAACVLCVASLHAAVFISILPLSMMAITMGPVGLLLVAVSSSLSVVATRLF